MNDSPSGRSLNEVLLSTQIFNVERPERGFNGRFNLDEYDYFISVNVARVQEHDVGGGMLDFFLVVGTFLDEIRDSFNSTDYVQIVIEAEDLEPIYLSYRRVSELNLDRLFASVEKILNSNEHVTIESGVLIKVSRVIVPFGGGYEDEKRRKSLVYAKGLDAFLKAKRNVVQVYNNVYPYCGVVALYFGFLLNIKGFRAINSVRRYLEKLILKVKPFLQKAGVALGTPLTTTQLKTIHSANDELNKYQLIIYEKRNADIKQVVKTAYKD